MTAPTDAADPNTTRTTRVATDAAVLVLFDPAELAARVNDEVDWWTGQDDLPVEQRAGRLVFIETGRDGVFHLEAGLGAPAAAGPAAHQTALLRVSSGQVVFGAGESLPGGGLAAFDDMGSLALPPGTYRASVTPLTAPPGCDGAYDIRLEAFAGSPPRVAPAAPAAGEGLRASQPGAAAGTAPDRIAPAELLAALGRPEADPAVARLVACIVPPPGTVVDAASGKRWHTSNAGGISILVAAGVVQAIELYSQMVSLRTQWGRYPYALPHELAFDMPKGEVLSRFGKPFLGTGIHWAIYQLAGHALRVGFAKDRLVNLVLMHEDHELLRA